MTQEVSIVWYPYGYADLDHDAHVFLSRAPLTFGHSQFGIPCNDLDEAKAFAVAARVIQEVISVFRNVLQERTLHQFPELAEYTNTRGAYKKLLLLRARVHRQITQGVSYGYMSFRARDFTGLYSIVPITVEWRPV